MERFIISEETNFALKYKLCNELGNGNLCNPKWPIFPEAKNKVLELQNCPHYKEIL